MESIIVGSVGMVKEITNDKDWKEWVLEAKDLVVVDFWASWCGPCLAMAPILDEVEKDISSAKFYKINVDEYTTKAQEFGITSIPQFYLFKDGKVKEIRRGGGTKEIMVQWVNDSIQ